MDKDAFQLNIDGVENLIGSETNKVSSLEDVREGVEGDEVDELELDMSDEELLRLSREYENKNSLYYGKEGIEGRQKQNKS